MDNTEWNAQLKDFQDTINKLNRFFLAYDEIRKRNKKDEIIENQFR